MEYFINFPTTVYNKTVVTDITKRVAILRDIANRPFAFAPYDMKEGERADRIADLYYGDASREWLVWMSNNIVDPYNEWFLPESVISDLCIEKYGSLQMSQLLTHHYVLNWGASDVNISVATFNAMTDNEKALYEPNYDDTQGARIISYSISQDNITYSTNMIVTMGIDNDIFDVGDYVTLPNGGHGEVCWSNSSVIRLQHFEDPGYDGSNTVITQYSTGGTANVSSFAYTSNTIPVDIRSMFIPVSMHDYEHQKNEQYKTIRLIDKKYVSEIESELKGLLS